MSTIPAGSTKGKAAASASASSSGNTALNAGDSISGLGTFHHLKSEVTITKKKDKTCVVLYFDKTDFEMLKGLNPSPNFVFRRTREDFQLAWTMSHQPERKLPGFIHSPERNRYEKKTESYQENKNKRSSGSIVCSGMAKIAPSMTVGVLRERNGVLLPVQEQARGVVIKDISLRRGGTEKRIAIVLQEKTADAVDAFFLAWTGGRKNQPGPVFTLTRRSSGNEGILTWKEKGVDKQASVGFYTALGNQQGYWREHSASSQPSSRPASPGPTARGRADEKGPSAPGSPRGGSPLRPASQVRGNSSSPLRRGGSGSQ